MRINNIIRYTDGRSRDIYSAGGWGKTRSNVSMCIIAASADDELSQHNPAIERRARFIAATADLSALGGCSDTQMNLLKLHHRARGTLKVHALVIVILNIATAEMAKKLFYERVNF